MTLLLQNRLFSEHFNPPLKEDYLCPICHEVLLHPVLTVECGHNFCNECIHNAVNLKPQCPLDNLPLKHANYFPDKKTERAIANKTVVCPNKDCDWKNNLTQLETHLNVCTHEVISCLFKCGIELKRSSMHFHETYECIKRTVQCKYCKFFFVFDFLNKTHASICPKTPLDCKNTCGVKIPRSEMNDHLKLHCLKEIVECPFVETGCNAKMKRSCLEAHLKIEMTYHKKILHNFTIQQKEKQSNTFQALQKASLEIQQLKTTHQNTLQDLSTLQRLIFDDRSNKLCMTYPSEGRIVYLFKVNISSNLNEWKEFPQTKSPKLKWFVPCSMEDAQTLLDNSWKQKISNQSTWTITYGVSTCPSQSLFGGYKVKVSGGGYGAGDGEDGACSGSGFTAIRVKGICYGNPNKLNSLACWNKYSSSIFACESIRVNKESK